MRQVFCVRKRSMVRQRPSAPVHSTFPEWSRVPGAVLGTRGDGTRVLPPGTRAQRVGGPWEWGSPHRSSATQTGHSSFRCSCRNTGRGGRPTGHKRISQTSLLPAPATNPRSCPDPDAASPQPLTPGPSVQRSPTLPRCSRRHRRPCTQDLAPGLRVCLATSPSFHP